MGRSRRCVRCVTGGARASHVARRCARASCFAPRATHAAEVWRPRTTARSCHGRPWPTLDACAYHERLDSGRSTPSVSSSTAYLRSRRWSSSFRTCFANRRRTTHRLNHVTRATAKSQRTTSDLLVLNARAVRSNRPCSRTPTAASGAGRALTFNSREDMLEDAERRERRASRARRATRSRTCAPPSRRRRRCREAVARARGSLDSL